MGGVPTIGLLEGGKIAKFKMEQVWVEAYVDYFPSRGMKKQVGDSWIPMDASFQQYDFTEGMNLKDQVPFDVEALANNIQSTFPRPRPMSAFDQDGEFSPTTGLGSSPTYGGLLRETRRTNTRA